MDNSSSNLASPSESGGNSKFKTLKKKIKNKFRLSRAEEGITRGKTIAEAVETLRRSNELLEEIEESEADALKIEFQVLKETLESILNQNQILSEVVKTVDSACPDPFNEPEKFSVFFAQKTVSSWSYSDELFEDEGKDVVTVSESDNVLPVPPATEQQAENALVRLQNLRMEEQKSFQMERENYESRLAQLSLLQSEMEMLRREKSEHEIQVEFLKNKSELVEGLKREIGELKRKCEELEGTGTVSDGELSELLKASHDKEISALKDSHVAELSQLKKSHMEELSQLTDARTTELSQLKDAHATEIDELESSLVATENKVKKLEVISQSPEDPEKLEAAHERDREIRELSEENVRLKLEFSEMEKELRAVRVQLNDFEKEIISEIDLENHNNNNNATCAINEKKEDDAAFKYVYLSNLVLRFMQFPEKRSALSGIILTTLQSDQEYFQKAMNKQQNK